MTIIEFAQKIKIFHQITLKIKSIFFCSIYFWFVYSVFRKLF